MATHFIFGPFTLDVANAELTRDGQVVKLPPQPFTALHLLVSRPATLITRDEFKTALWGDDSFVDFNGGLNFCMAQLRAALDDRAAASTYIATVPRRGYKFIAPVQAIDLAAPERDRTGGVETANAIPEPLDAIDGDTGGRGRWRRAASLGIAAAAVVVLSVVAWPSHSRTDAAGLSDAERRLAAAGHVARGSLALADAGPSELPVRIKHFQEAIASDPRHAEAFAGLAEARLIAGAYRVEPPQAAYAAAKAAAAEALALNPDLADAHALFGAAAMYFDWDWKTAGQHLAQAVALDTDSSRAHQLYGRFLSATGRHDEAERHARRAVELAPASASASTDLGLALFFAGRWDEAIASCDEAVRLLPAFLPAHRCAADAAAEKGALGLAAHYTARTLRTAGDAARAPAVAEDAAAFWPRKAARLQEAAADSCQAPSFALAVAFAHLGRDEESIATLERAVAQRVDAVLVTAVHPAFRSLRANPRFTAVVRRIGLQPR